MEKPRIEWKFNPSSLLSIIVACGAVIALFVRADARVDGNTDHLNEHARAIFDLGEAIEASAKVTAVAVEAVARAQAQSETNTAVLMQWQRDQDRRIDRLENEEW